MIGPISRILARYIAGMLVAAGLLDVSFGHEIGADPDFALILQTVIGFVLMSVTEGWYWFCQAHGPGDMMAAILRTLGLDLIGSLERAYIAKEKAKSDRERLLHAERIKDIEAELESQRTATGFALGQMNHPVWWAAWLLFVLPVGFYTAAIFLVSTVPALEWWEVRRVPQVQEDWARWIVLSIFGAQIVAGGIGRKLRGGS